MNDKLTKLPTSPDLSPINTIKSLKNHQGFMKYFRNTSWLLGEKILRMAVGLFVGVWVARYLGPEQFGLLSYAQSFVGLFTVIATLGLDTIIVRELVKDETKRNVLLGTAFGLKFIGAILVLIFLAIAINFTSNDQYTNVLIFIIASATIFQSFNVVDFYFQAKVLSKYVVYTNVISLSTSSIIKITLIINEASIVAFAIVVVFDSLVLALGFLYFYFHQNLSVKQWVFDRTKAKELLKESYPLIIAGVINSIYMKVDQVMIKEMLGNTQIGYYAAAVKLSEVWFSIGVIICNSLFPAIVNAKMISEKFYYQRISNLFMLLNLLSFCLAISVYLLSDYIILTLYRKDFFEASTILSIHIFSAIFVYLGVASGRWLINEGKTILNLYRNIIGMLINVMFNIILIKKYGIAGAAIASLFAYITAFYLFDIFRKDTRRLFILKTKSLIFLRERT